MVRAPAPDAIVPHPDRPELAPERSRLTVSRDLSDPHLEDPAEELADALDDDDAIPISAVPELEHARDSTGLPTLDYVLGGGFVTASVVLLAAVPGCGKTSLSLQMLHGLGHRCLYVTGEETREQIAGTARRIGAASDSIFVFVERRLDKIFTKSREKRVRAIVIDSIQKMLCDDVSGRPGSPSQLKECTARLVDFAKTTGTALWLIGHVTSDGDIAGPRTIEHDVDVVLELEPGAGNDGNERILRASKNRFGPSNIVGRFVLTAEGFVCCDGDGWDKERL